MARNGTNELAVAELNRALTKLNRRRHATQADIYRWAIREHDFDISDETIRTALAGKADPTSCNVGLLIILMAFFDAEPEDLGHHAARRIRSVMSAIGAGDGGPRRGREQVRAATDRTRPRAKPSQLWPRALGDAA